MLTEKQLKNLVLQEHIDDWSVVC